MRLHEGGHRLTRDRDGRLHVHRPGGRPLQTEPIRVDPAERLEQHNRQLGLHIGPDTNEPLWEGRGGDLSATIEYLNRLLSL